MKIQKAILPNKIIKKIAQEVSGRIIYNDSEKASFGPSNKLVRVSLKEQI